MDLWDVISIGSSCSDIDDEEEILQHNMWVSSNLKRLLMYYPPPSPEYARYQLSKLYGVTYRLVTRNSW